MQSKALELLVGFFFALGVSAIFILTVRVASLNGGDPDKTYRVSASIPKGGTRGEFQVVADPFTVPLMSPRAQDDYEILVGFQGAEKPAAEKKRKGG